MRNDQCRGIKIPGVHPTVTQVHQYTTIIPPHSSIKMNCIPRIFHFLQTYVGNMWSKNKKFHVILKLFPRIYPFQFQNQKKNVEQRVECLTCWKWFIFLFYLFVFQTLFICGNTIGYNDYFHTKSRVVLWANKNSIECRMFFLKLEHSVLYASHSITNIFVSTYRKLLEIWAF